MKKLYNVIFPIWLILLLPPIVLLVIPSNFIIDSIVVLWCLKLLKEVNIFDKYKKTILKVWIIGFIADILGSFLLLLTQFIPSNGFWYEMLISPLAWNPFSSVIAFLYVLAVVILSAYLIYIINYKISFKKVDIEKENKRKVCLALALFTAPYLFFLPTSYFYNYNKYKTLEDYRDVYVGDNSAVGNIINRLYSSSYYDHFELQTKEKPYAITIIYKNNEYGDMYKHLEKDASVLCSLVKNVDIINFEIDKTYTFNRNDINQIYKDVKKVAIEDIMTRYEDEKFEQFTYLGHISSYDLFDTDTTCGIEKKLLFSDEQYNYYVECASIESLYLVNSATKIKLTTALKDKKISIDSLFSTNLKITKGDKQ